MFIRKLIFLFLLSVSVIAQKEISSQTFASPPDAYGIRCWWWWLNSNVTKESITRDLEAMKDKGFSGACLFDAGGQNQRGNRDVPAGPLWGSPEWQQLYLHAVNEAERLGLELSLSIQSGWNLGGPTITPQQAAKQVTFVEIKVHGGRKLKRELPVPPHKDGFYEDIAILAYPLKQIAPDRPPIKDFDNKSARKEVGWSVPETRPLLFDIEGTPGEEDAGKGEVLNLTPYFKKGNLNWKAPEGDWVIMRLGYTPTNAEVSTSSGEWHGRVLDYLSEQAFTQYWNRHVEPLLSMIGGRAGKTLRYLQTDSFEAGGMNWTDDFAEEFQKRRGYEITPFLPVLAGKIIEDRQTSANFLNDFRKTIGELVSDHHYKLFAEKAAAYGLGIQPESAGPHAGPFDGLQNYSHSELMMSEFWSPSPHRSKPIDRFFVKQAASAAKIFNKKLVGAESFTTIGPHWNDVPWRTMKPAADHEFAAGLNLIFLHTFTNSPKEMGLPGQEYFAGTHMNPNITWWPLADGFFDYLKRIQYLTQNSRSVADVLYYYGDHVPVLGRYKEDDPAGVLPNYDYDLCNEDVLLSLQVQDGKIVLPHGETYELLALPDHGVLSLAVLQKLEELVTAGARVMGVKPQCTASLVGNEKEAERIIDLLWAEQHGSVKHIGQGMVMWPEDKNDAALVLDTLEIKPALEIEDNPELENGSRRFDYIQRKWGETDLYFISNQTDDEQNSVFTFPFADRQPELWNPMTGETRKLRHFILEADGRLSLDLQFGPYESYFIVLRNPLENFKPEIFHSDFKELKVVDEITGSWEVTFDPKWGGPGTVVFPALSDWSKNNIEGVKYYSGSAVYRKVFVTDPSATQIDLGTVKDVGVACVKLNGEDLGIFWAPPYRVSVNGKLNKNWNLLEVEVINSWRNRLIGDKGKPKKEQLTNTNITVTDAWKLEPSGLLGTVRVLREE